MVRKLMNVDIPDGHELLRSKTDPAALRALTHDGQHLGPHASLYELDEPNGTPSPAEVLAAAALIGIGVGGTLGVKWLHAKWQARKAAVSVAPEAEEPPLVEPILLRPENRSAGAA